MATRIEGRFARSARATPANAITSVRVLASPFMVLAIVDLGATWLTVVIWIGLSSTDFVDGWVARRQGVTTSGAFLDPLADKILVLGALGALASTGKTGWWAVGIIAARELLISLYRTVMARRAVSVPARSLGKAKTVAQDLAITLLLLPLTGRHHAWLGRDVLWLAVILALVSGAQYLLDGRASLSTTSSTPVSDKV